MKKIQFRWLIPALIVFSLCACGTSQSKLNMQTTQTAEAQVTAQTTRTPTLVSAKFLNPPEFLEEKFKSSSGWLWLEAVEGRRCAFRQSKNYQTTFYLVHEKDMIEVAEVDSFSDVFVNYVLDLFVPLTTKEAIIQFRNDHLEPGTYQTIIDGFKVELNFSGKGNYSVAVYESQ